MKRLIIATMTEDIADRFAKAYAEAELLGEHKVYLEILNEIFPVKDDEEGTLISLFEFREKWSGGSPVSYLEHYWSNDILGNVLWFYHEHYREIGVELIHELVSGGYKEISLRIDPDYLYIEVTR